MTLALSDEEREMLAQLLAQDLRELRVEINHTDDRAFKAHLQHREQVLSGLLTRLGGALPDA